MYSRGRTRPRSSRRSADVAKFLRSQCQAFPNFCGSNAKLFQRFLWWFCGIPTGYAAPNQKSGFLQTFIRQMGSRFLLLAQTRFEDEVSAETKLTRISFFRKMNLRIVNLAKG